MVFKVFRCESPSELRRDAADSLGMGITSSWLMMVSNNEAPRQSQYKMKGDKIMDNILKSNYDQSLYSFIFFLCPDLIQSKNKYKWWWHQRINTPNFLDFWSSFWTFDHLFFCHSVPKLWMPGQFLSVLLVSCICLFSVLLCGCQCQSLDDPDHVFVCWWLFGGTSNHALVLLVSLMLRWLPTGS